MNFEELVAIVARLRGPDGCPWDREQTRESLRPFLVEEFYEVIDAMEEEDTGGIREELGDLLFQIVLQSQLFSEEGTFGINDVIEGIGRKMVSRHPHVFGDKDLKTAEDVSSWWAEHKRKEGKGHDSAIGGVPASLPSLIRAQEIQRRATRVGFDWEKIDDVFQKLEEEVRELRDAAGRNNRDELEDEIGDLLFVLVRIASSFDIDAENALRRSIRKFIRRFRHMETGAGRQGRSLSDMTLAEMDVLWNEAKKQQE
ncbi:MAG: nucleoside triphosphate pyrophosphohydrolase [Nitrospiraceae bacterium]|nr:MAG: nucleoside triphosphate pyrophosphohydrolase [Nitrospiraceae bacterium]